MLLEQPWVQSLSSVFVGCFVLLCAAPYCSASLYFSPVRCALFRVRLRLVHYHVEPPPVDS